MMCIGKYRQWINIFSAVRSFLFLLQLCSKSRPQPRQPWSSRDGAWPRRSWRAPLSPQTPAGLSWTWPGCPSRRPGLRQCPCPTQGCSCLRFQIIRIKSCFSDVLEHYKVSIYSNFNMMVNYLLVMSYHEKLTTIAFEREII